MERAPCSPWLRVDSATVLYIGTYLSRWQTDPESLSQQSHALPQLRNLIQSFIRNSNVTSSIYKPTRTQVDYPSYRSTSLMVPSARLICWRNIRSVPDNHTKYAPPPIHQSWLLVNSLTVLLSALPIPIGQLYSAGLPRLDSITE